MGVWLLGSLLGLMQHDGFQGYDHHPTVPTYRCLAASLPGAGIIAGVC